MAKKPRRFIIELYGTIPPGMTVAQVRRAYWNQGFNGEGPGYNAVSVEVDDFFEEYRPNRRPMKVRLGRVRLVK